MEPVTFGWPVIFAITLAAISVRSAVAIGVVFAWSQSSTFAQRRRIYRLAFGEGQLLSELKAAVAVLTLDALVLASVRYFGVVRFDADPPWLASILAFSIMFVWIEIWFYASHRAMHHRALYWIHRQHHVARVTNPVTSLSFSLIERAILLGGILGFAALLSFVFPLGLGALILVGLSNYLLNVLGHSNVEFMPEWIVRSRIGQVFITPSYHAMHHARYKGHYGLFTTCLDRWFNTRFGDYEAVYDRARSGGGMTRLGERIAAP